MEKFKPTTEIDHRLVSFRELAFKVADGKVVTAEIDNDNWLLYLNAGSATGFKVEKIADEGEEFPFASSKKRVSISIDFEGGELMPVSRMKVTEKGHIAISIETPEGKDSRFNGPFWNHLENIRRAQALPSPDST